MASTLTKLLLHITFSTKNRIALLPVEVESDLYSYFGGICRRLNSPFVACNGTEDHVHLLVSLSKTISLSELILNLKRDSSKRLKSRHERLSTFAWQEGYFAFSIGASGVDALQRYIAGQKEHHKRVHFKDEMRTFLTKYGIQWDERYAWD